MSEGGDGRAAREAAEWLARLNSRSVSTEELNAFYEWRRDPENAEAYARGEQLWHESRALGDDRDIAQAVREALERPRLGRTRSVPSRRMVLVGIGTVAVAAGGGGWLLLTQPQRYKTRVGEQLLVNLEDGSRLRLNTDSEAAVRFSSSARQVELSRGQAFFEVAPNPSRPFRVQAANVEVVAVGTRFDVWKQSDQEARVVLAEGRIDVRADDRAWASTLSRAGDSVTLRPSERPQIVSLDVEAATSWTGGRLHFRRTPLADAIAEMNRYSAKQISLEAPRLRSLEVDGVFAAGDPDSFVAALTALFPLRARQVSNDRIVLVPA